MITTPDSSRAARPSPASRLVAVLVAVTVGFGLSLVAAPAQAAPPKGLTVKQAIQSHPTIKVGQRDKAVTYLKRRFGAPNRTPRYGKAIAAKVARFEARNGMARDRGRVTAETWRTLGVPYSSAAAVARKRAGQQAGRSTTRSAAVLREAARHAGKPYAYGGNGPYAFDCSGYTRYVFNKVGVNLPRTAAQQRGATRWISRSQARPGDLVFVHSGSYVSHVAIYAGNNMWWESSRPGRPVGKNRAWTTSVSFGRV